MVDDTPDAPAVAAYAVLVRSLVGFLVVALCLLAAGLLLEGAGHDWGVVLIVLGGGALVMTYAMLPEPRELLSDLRLLVLVAGLVFLLKALGAPGWLQAAVIGGIVVAWVVQDLRTDPRGCLRIPPSHRFRSGR